MAKFLKWTFYILAGLGVFLFIGFKVLQSQTKKNSPEDRVTYNEGGNKLAIFYNRPYKKDRQIFGALVAYNEVWRTGANEATTFSNKQPINFGGKPLPAGEYTLWTIPGPESWSVILNSKQYSWGVSFGGVASREAEADILKVEVPSRPTEEEVEQFTIEFQGSGSTPTLVLSWDNTEVSIPMSW